MTYRMMEINEKYDYNTKAIVSSFGDKFLHAIPQMLFLSLPIVALVLKLLYICRKQFYYVDHGIFVVHIYIFVFLISVLQLGVDALNSLTGWEILGFVGAGLVLWIMIYLYAAMRRFISRAESKRSLSCCFCWFLLYSSPHCCSLFSYFSPYSNYNF